MSRAAWMGVGLLAVACGSAAVPAPAPPEAAGGQEGPLTAATGPPTWSSEFEADDPRWSERVGPGGRIEFGTPEAGAGDGAAASLVFAGDPAAGPADRVGPGFASEIQTRERLRFGTFRARLRPPSCLPGEEAVAGFFTYFNDGSDTNGNGLPDNAEIDIELLCGTPEVIFLSVWTDYRASPEGFVKRTRAVDLRTGAYYESPSDHEYGIVHRGTLPELARPGFPEPGGYYEMGFDWLPTRVRFFIVLDDRERTLWDMADARYVPQRPSYWMFNVWHPATHWFGDGGPARHPARDAVLSLDWARYWEPSSP